MRKLKIIPITKFTILLEETESFCIKQINE